tara:strand:+ start:1109 stop:1288 length:180 start_codon:yes stop_codon:yes gene_type:complete
MYLLYRLLHYSMWWKGIRTSSRSETITMGTQEKIDQTLGLEKHYTSLQQNFCEERPERI